ncbi:MAG: putative metal-binding motif-containing protein [Haloferula sp.]
MRSWTVLILLILAPPLKAQVSFEIDDSFDLGDPWNPVEDATIMVIGTDPFDVVSYEVSVPRSAEDTKRFFRATSEDPFQLLLIENVRIGESDVTFHVLRFPDADGDGWYDFIDCAPNDPNIHPSAEEICGDSIDNDCSGVADDRDGDLDGFIAATCGGDDSDDTSESINPAVAENCIDGIDNNGNGLLDDADPGCATGCDQDGDGFASFECGGTDPDDANAAVHPGASEVCDDYLDNDLDGLIDEGCPPAELRLIPPDQRVLAEAIRNLLVIEDGAIQNETPWIYEVNGIQGGNEAVGTLGAIPQNPGRAFYTAPEVTTATSFVVSAIDPGNPLRRAETSIEVFPLSGTNEIVPSNPTVGLARTLAFSAGNNVPGVGVIPIPNARWYVNGLPGGGILPVPGPNMPGIDVGKIDLNGVYTAPSKLPANLPFQVTIGFSLPGRSTPLLTTNVTLAELKVTPSVVTGLNVGVAGQLAGSIKKSDNSVTPLTGANMTYVPSDPLIANANGTGQVLVGERLGQTTILATDPTTGARDLVTVHSRTDVELTLQVIEKSLDHARIDSSPDDASEIEYTCPGAEFEVRPLIKRLRGPQAGKIMSGRMTASVELSADGSKVFDYQPPEPVPQATGTTAVLRQDTGIVEIGDVPGSGTITASYNDGFVQHQATLTVIYTRPDITITTSGRRSGDASPYLTEEVEVFIEATNNGGFSSFIGELPVRISFLDSEQNPQLMDVFYRNSPFSGYAWSNSSPLNLNQQTTQLELTAPSTEDSLDGFGGGKMRLRFFSSKAGPHTLRVENRCDTTAPPTDQAIVIRKPELALRHNSAQEIDPTSPWVKGSWLNVHHRASSVPDRVSIYDLYSRDSVESFARDDVPRWNLTLEGTETISVPITDDPLINASGQAGGGGQLSFVPKDAGLWTVNLSFTERSYLMSKDLVLNVVEPTDAGSVALVAQNDDFGAIISADQTLGAFQIVEQLEGPWVKDQPFTLKIQTYPAASSSGPIVPRPVGHERTERVLDSDNNLISETVTTYVGGVSVTAASPHTINVTGDQHPTTTDGIITLTVTPTAGPGEQDLILRLTPVMQVINGAGHSPGLPSEVRVRKGSIRTRAPEDGNVPAIAMFAEAKNQTFLNQCALVQGKGIAFSPRFVPVTSDRVIEAVNAGRLPAGKDKAVIYAEGAGAVFQTAIAGGVPAGQITGLPPGVSVSGTQVVDGRVEITLDTHGSGASGRHEIGFDLAGVAWRGAVQFVSLELAHPADHANEHIPLNGNHHQMHPVGTNMIRTINNSSGDPSIPNSVRLELFPSRKPGDPVNISKFRNKMIDQPMVGWSRELDGERKLKVSLLEQNWLVQRNNFVIVYGNITDEATLDLKSQTLNDFEGPDLLPDFVSTAPNAEMAAVSIGGNYLDVLPFTAFNFVAKPQADDSSMAPELDFDELKSGAIDDVYAAYQSSARGSSLRDAASLGSIAGVSIDTESDRGTSRFDSPFKHIRNSGQKIVPQSYYGGILDQYYLAELRGSPYTVPPGVFRTPIGQDGRVGAFDGEFGMSDCRDATGGILRRCFGIELDGVIYDPSLLLNDYDPNGSEFFSIPIVNANLSRYSPAGLTPNLELFPDLGGTSGGRYVLDTSDGNTGPLGEHYVLSKTPGADFPGLYAGYPIQGSPNDLLTPITGSIKDDIEDAALKRAFPTGPLTNEKSLDLFDDRRRVMTFGSAHDAKNAISTALNRTFYYKIESDPIGVDDISFRGALQVAELPRPAEESVDLIITTQSDGWESIIKSGYDATIDVVAGIISTVALNAVTGGTYGPACTADNIAASARSTVKASVEKFVVDSIGSELHNDDYFQVEGTPLYGRRRTPQLTFKAINPDLLGGRLPIKLEAQKLFRNTVFKSDGGAQLFSNVQGEFRKLTLCGLLKLPFSKAAGAVKNLVTEESLGGGGAARATATKILVVEIPMSATQDLEGTNFAWFQVDQSVMITPDEQEVHDTSLALNTEIKEDRADTRTDADLVRHLYSVLDSSARGSGPYNEAAAYLSWLRSKSHHVVKRTPNTNIGGQLGTDTYEDYRVRIATIPGITATVVPNANVSDFKLKTGDTRIPVTSASIVTALRSNQNAGARASITNPGYTMTVVGATIPGPFDP